MANQFFLNALAEIDRQLEVPTPGRWKGDEQSKDFLGKYVADIHIDAHLDLREVHSLPSVFARPIQFWQALRTTEHPLHDAVVSQWRGLLAVFALQEWLTLMPVPQLYEVPSAGHISMGIDQNLHTILRNQLPKPERYWERWWLLYCDDYLIGATSPWTIVYTPSAYTCPPTIPWRTDEGLLMDPITYYDPQETGGQWFELALLLRWVELILQGHPWNMDKDKAGIINRELTAWQASLRKYRDPALAVPALAQFPAVGVAPYRHFLVPPQPANPVALGSVGPLSDLILASPKQQEQTLALPRSGVDGKKRVYHSVLVDRVDLAHLPGPTGDAGWQAGNGRQIPLPYVVPEEAFFPAKLVQLKLSDKALVKGTQLAIPLTRLFFQYFDHTDLPMLTVSDTGQEMRVRLRLPLANGSTLAVEKTYDKATQIVSLDANTPALAAWPDFYDIGWYENFALAAVITGMNLVVAPLLSNGTELARTVENGTQKPLRIWSSALPILGFVLYSREQSGELIESGLVLRGTLPPATTPHAGRTWVAAVDFGTSNTHVMVQKDGGSPVPFPLRGRTVLLTAAPDFVKESVISGFYPDEEIMPPFVTILAAGGATTFSTDEHLEYVPRFLFYPELAGSQEIVQGLKWGTGGIAAADKPLKAYLHGVARYIACEAWAAGVGDLSFTWAYPLSLHNHTQAAMGILWNNIGTAFAKPQALSITATAGVPESDALCRYLGTNGILPTNADALSIAVDVGGGSTDIGFWSKNIPVDQVSFKLAANDLLEPLCRRSDFTRTLYQFCGGTLDQNGHSPLDQQFTRYPMILCNALLAGAKARMDGSQDPRTHPVVKALFASSYGQPPWQYARSVIYLFFSGLAFYLGLHSRKHVATLLPEVHIYFGGRGSSLLAWLDNDAPRIQTTLHRAFTAGLTHNNPAPQSINVYVGSPVLSYNPTHPPKQEVAGGLLSPLPGGMTVSTLKGSTIVGEEGWTENGTAVPWDRELTAVELSRLKPPTNYSGSYLDQFFKHVRSPQWLQSPGLDENNLQKLGHIPSATMQSLLLTAVSGGSEILQPIFAHELKAVIGQYLGMMK
jgi:hypothetical protein